MGKDRFTIQFLRTKDSMPHISKTLDQHVDRRLQTTPARQVGADARYTIFVYL